MMVSVQSEPAAATMRKPFRSWPCVYVCQNPNRTGFIHLIQDLAWFDN